MSDDNIKESMTDTEKIDSSVNNADLPEQDANTPSSEEDSHAFGPKIDTIMIKNVISIPNNGTIETALSLMNTHRICCLPVVDGDKCIGLITKFDVLHVKSIFSNTNSQIDRDQALLTIPVKNIIEKRNIHCISPDRTVGHAAHIMKEKDILGIVITDPSEKLLGIVTYDDLLTYLCTIA